jgi:hypothetical protein
MKTREYLSANGVPLKVGMTVRTNQDQLGKVTEIVKDNPEHHPDHVVVVCGKKPGIVTHCAPSESFIALSKEAEEALNVVSKETMKVSEEIVSEADMNETDDDDVNEPTRKVVKRKSAKRSSKGRNTR